MGSSHDAEEEMAWLVNVVEPVLLNEGSRKRVDGIFICRSKELGHVVYYITVNTFLVLITFKIFYFG